jgi:hypothetical protein
MKNKPLQIIIEPHILFGQNGHKLNFAALQPGDGAVPRGGGDEVGQGSVSLGHIC